MVEIWGFLQEQTWTLSDGKVWSSFHTCLLLSLGHNLPNGLAESVTQMKHIFRQKFKQKCFWYILHFKSTIKLSLYAKSCSFYLVHIQKIFSFEVNIRENMWSLKKHDEYSQTFLKMKVPMASVLSHHFKETISRSHKRPGSPKTLGCIVKITNSVWEKPRNEGLCLFPCHSGLLRTYYLNPYIPVLDFCGVSSGSSLNLFTTNVTLEELWYRSYSYIFHFSKLHFEIFWQG